MPSRPPDVVVSSSRDRLLQAARRLFAAKGYEQTATSAIARAAGTSESQLMRYFGGKAGLLHALLDDEWSELNRRVKRVLQTEASARDALLLAIQTITTALERDPDLGTLFVLEGRRLRGGEPRVRLSSGLVTFGDTVRGLVRKAQAAGEIDPGLDAGAVTSSVLGAAEAMVRDRLLTKAAGKRPFGKAEIRRTINAMLSGFQNLAKRRTAG